MKKIILGTAAMFLLSGVAAYAGGGKKKAKKAARRQECCIKTTCPDKTKCNSVKYAENATTGKAEEAKTGSCPGAPLCCNKGG